MSTILLIIMFSSFSAMAAVVLMALLFANKGLHVENPFDAQDKNEIRRKNRPPETKEQSIEPQPKMALAARLEMPPIQGG